MKHWIASAYPVIRATKKIYTCVYCSVTTFIKKDGNHKLQNKPETRDNIDFFLPQPIRSNWFKPIIH